MDDLVLLIRVLLTVFFVFASSIKLFGWQKTIFETQLAFFRKYGLNRTVMALVGIVELSAAIALWLPAPLDLLGALALAGLKQWCEQRNKQTTKPFQSAEAN